MGNPFDQLGKKIGLRALAPSGRTAAQYEIPSNARQADLRHEPDPAREAERARLGLLGRLASVPCLIEMFSSAPGEEKVVDCMGKLIAYRQERRREARKRKRRRRRRDPQASGPAPPFVKPFLWLITAGRPTRGISMLGAVQAERWPRGVYLSPLELRKALGQKPNRTEEEEAFIMSTQDIVEELRREGMAEGHARALLTALRVRGIAVPDAARERILAVKDPACLERWLERAIVAASLDEVMDDPS